MKPALAVGAALAAGWWLPAGTGLAAAFLVAVAWVVLSILVSLFLGRVARLGHDDERATERARRRSSERHNLPDWQE